MNNIGKIRWMNRMAVCIAAVCCLLIISSSVAASASEEFAYIPFMKSDQSFGGPGGIAVDSSGNQYILDSTSRRVVVFDSNDQKLVEWGSLGSGDGYFQYPTGIAVYQGFVYVVDNQGNNIQKFDAYGNFIKKWGTSGTGNGQFSSPQRIAISSNIIYVTDAGNDRVQTFDIDGNYQSQWGGNGSGEGEFSYPTGIATDQLGNIYVSDGNYRVQKFNAASVFILQWGSSGTGDGQFGYGAPVDIAIDNENQVYVVDHNNANVQKFNSDGEFIVKWGSYGSNDGQFIQPYGIAVDQNGVIYVAEASNKRIQRFDGEGAFISKLGIYGIEGELLYQPQGVAINADGEIYISSGNKVKKFNASGTFLLEWGAYGTADGQFASVNGVALDQYGYVYVADSGNHRIQKFDAVGTFISKWGSQGSGDGQFNTPVDLDFDSDGNIYVVESIGNRVQKFDSNGGFLLKWGSSGSFANGEFSTPVGIAVDSLNNIYVADQFNAKIQKFDSSGVHQLNITGGAFGTPTYLSRPHGITIDKDNDTLYIPNYSNYVMVFASNGDFITTWGYNFWVPQGLGDAKLNNPKGIELDSSGNVYVIDNGNDRLVKYSPSIASVSTTTIRPNFEVITADGLSNTTIKIQLLNDNSNYMVTSGGVVELSTTLGSLGSVTDQGNGLYTATLSSTTIAGTANISGTLEGVALSDIATVTFAPGAASTTASTITAGSSPIVADGVTTSVISVQLIDVNGNELTTGGDTIVLSTSQGSLGGVTDVGDGTYTATLTSSTTVGTATVSGTLNGADIADTAVVTMVPGAASTATSTITAGTVSLVADGEASSVITVKLFDAQGNALTTGGNTVTFYHSNGSMSEVTDHGDGTYTADFSSTITGTIMVSGIIDGSTMSASTNVSFTPGAASTEQSEINPEYEVIVADGVTTSLISVQLKDSFGNNVESGGDTVLLSTSYGSLSSVTDVGDGTYTAILTSDISVGTANISGTLNGAAISDTTAVNFVPGNSSYTTSTITASSTLITADGSSTTIITVQLKDGNGNDLLIQDDIVTLSTNLGTLSTVTASVYGSYTAELTSDTSVGTATISGILNGLAITDTTAVNFVPGAASSATSIISAGTGSLIADGETIVVITAQLIDANGNELTTGGDTIVLSTSLGSLGGVTDVGDGTYTATLTSSTAVGTATVSGTLNGSPIINSEVINFVPGNSSYTTSIITASPTLIIADGSSTTIITVQLKDGNGNDLLIQDDIVTLSTNLGTLSTVTASVYGSYTAELISIEAGTASISGAINGINILNTVMVTFVPDDASPSESTIMVNPVAVTANGINISTITVQIKDMNGNLRSAGEDQVRLSTNLGTLSSVTDHNNGSYTATLTSSAAGSALVNGTVNGTSLVATGTVTFTPVTPDPTSGPTPAGTPDTPGASAAATATTTSDLGSNNVGAKLQVKADVQTSDNGTTSSKVIVDTEQLTESLASLNDKDDAAKTVTIAVEGDAQEVNVDLPIAALLNAVASDTQGTIVIKTNSATYDMPLSLLKKLTENSPEGNISITINKISGELGNSVIDKAEASQVSLLLDNPIEFKITAGDKEITEFGGTYVERTVNVDQPVDPSTSTAVWYDPTTGTFRFVPSIVTETNGTTQVVMKSPHNSMYTIIQSDKSFDDITRHWAKKDIEMLASKLIVNGVSETSFAPESKISRAEFVALLVRSLGLTVNSNLSSFIDIKVSDWYAGDVEAAVKADLVKGYADGAFQPNSEITREQMAAMIASAMKFVGKDPVLLTSDSEELLARFADVDKIQTWAKEAVAQSVKVGIVNGRTDATFAPSADATRAEAVSMLRRMLQYIEFINQ